MSFKAKLTIGDKEIDVLSCTYDLIQEVDATGRPSSITRGGRIKLITGSTGDTFFFEWMCKNYERKDGSISFFKRDTNEELKKLEFKYGYLVKYEENYNATENRMVESFMISAHTITMGSGEHVNPWDGEM